MKFGPKFLLTFLLILFFFYFSFIFYSGNWNYGFSITLLSHCHKSHDTVTVMVTDHEVTIEESRRF